ncbi:MAG: galactosyltransferase-related protein, partial [Mariprofundaceae bacterium]
NGYAQQTDRNFSIYIADDGSGPEIFNLIEEFKCKYNTPIQHLWHEDNGYRRAQIINRAIQRVQEPYILLTDADCVPLPDMISTHRAIAQPGIFIRGSRILLAEAITKRLSERKTWSTDLSLWQWILWRAQKRINRLFPLLLPVGTSQPSEQLYGVRGCHFAFWKQDMVTINGFDSSYEGWGREDSDLAARLFHAGIKRKNLRGMPVLHLWHAEASRDKLATNDVLLQQCLEEKRIEAICGLKQLENMGE